MRFGYTADGTPVEDLYADLDDIYLPSPSIFFWGQNATDAGTGGLFGNGATASASTPTAVPVLSIPTSAAVSSNATLLVINGQIWGTGVADLVNYGSARSLVSYARVGLGSDWRSVAVGDQHAFAIKNNGELWGWTRDFLGNVAGALGNGTSGSLSVVITPTRIGGLIWDNIAISTASASSDSFSIGVTTDGKLYSAGYNLYGQLGLSNTSTTTSFSQVGTLTTWTSATAGFRHSAALRTDGTLWVWGDNSVGQLGQSNTIHRSSPVQVGLSTTWRSISAGDVHNLAVRTDGTLWAWGLNTEGQLGVGGTFNQLSPVQVGTLNTWKKIWAGSRTAIATNL